MTAAFPAPGRTRANLYRPQADLVGAVASGACAVHCALMPFAAALLPAASARVFEGSLFHGLLAVLVVVTSFVAFLPGWLRHGEGRIWRWALSGLALVAYARLADPASLGTAGEALCTTAGGALLIVAHRLNHSLSYWCDRP